MANELIFMMGEYEAHFPIDRKYCRNHMWMLEDAGRQRFGFSAYAVRLLQDVYFLDWLVDSPAEVSRGQEIGSIESSKALSSLFSPLEGTITRFNEDLLDDPSAINAEGYGKGWLFEMQGEISAAFSAEEYVRVLDEGWEKTQRTLKLQFT